MILLKKPYSITKPIPTMVEAVTKARGLTRLAIEVGFEDISQIIHLGADSSAAKSFACPRGLGRMKHIEIRDVWLQKGVEKGIWRSVRFLGIRIRLT